MQISEPSVQQAVTPLWRLAFRAGFLAAAAFAVLAMLRWLTWITWPQHWDYQMFPAWWHGHEMIFGFAMAVVAGFLLSAVATWTGLPGTRGRPLVLLFGLWLLARLVLWLAPGLLLLAWLAEMGFFALLTWELGKRVWATRQRRNMIFPPLLLALAALCSASYLAHADIPRATQLHFAAVWMITVLVVIIGGRVIPLFTGNRLGLKITPLPAWLEYSAIALTIAIAALVALQPSNLPKSLLAGLGILGATAHLVRLGHWRGWQTWRIPLLWSMHLSYLCIPLAMLAFAAAQHSPVAMKNIMHLLAIGTIGGMILAMMARVALGHTGRPLEVPGYIAVAFALVFIAAIVRAVPPLLDPALSQLAWRWSAILWIVAFASYLVHYWPVLSRPRVDGKDG